jgi:hypothetical protein
MLRQQYDHSISDCFRNLQNVIGLCALSVTECLTKKKTIVLLHHLHSPDSAQCALFLFLNISVALSGRRCIDIIIQAIRGTHLPSFNNELLEMLRNVAESLESLFVISLGGYFDAVICIRRILLLRREINPELSLFDCTSQFNNHACPIGE